MENSRMVIIQPDACPKFFETLRNYNTVVAVSGYFDPPTPGHIIYLREARKLGTVVVLILNNDEQLLKKRASTPLEGRIRYPFADRAMLLSEWRSVDVVVKSIDTDATVARTLKAVRPHYFAKGGDRTLANLPQAEIDTCLKIGCEMVFGVGGAKTHWSSRYAWE